MASRIANKINRQALQNICKSLYSSSSESSCYPRSSSNDAVAAAPTITSTSPTINNNSNNVNVTQSPNTGVAPPPTPVTITPVSANSAQSQYINQSQPPNTPIEEFDSQEVSGKDAPQTRSGTSQMPTLSTAYQVCPLRPKTVPTNYQPAKNQFNPAGFNKTATKVNNESFAEDLLQPSKQPEYYVMENAANTPKACAEALKEAVAHGSSLKEASANEINGGYRKFQESMTYRNLTQPFKFSRLANPFPEPVKEMPSQKVTDQEKAAQMFAEARNNALAQSHFAQRQKQLSLKPQVPLQPNFVRHYATSGNVQCADGGGGKKGKSKKPKFRKIKTDKVCPPANKSTGCRDHAYIYKKCTKKEAPYPSYSESCHEDKPLVNRCCPWMDEIHPAFKQKKKDYHTASRSMSLASAGGTSVEANSGASSHDMDEVNSIPDDRLGNTGAMELKKDRKKPECQPHPELNKVPCAWVEIDRKEDFSRSVPRKKPKPITSYKKKVLKLETEPCVSKTNKRCPPNTNTNPPADKKRNSPEKKAVEVACTAQHMPEDVATPAVGQSIDDWLAGLHPSKAETHCKVVTLAAGGPCPKFPFKPQSFNLVINRKPKLQSGKCPKKTKRPLIQDCPGRNTGKKGCLAEMFDNVLMLAKVKDDKKKCPEVPEHPSPKPTKIIDPADPCDRKPKPLSEICPGDLLTRKRTKKPTKKATEREEDFEQAIEMLDSIQRTRSAPSLFKPYTFKQ